ncbi:MAG: YkgJ family cysteine cluster protein [Pseudodesulfovibrio sp.]
MTPDSTTPFVLDFGQGDVLRFDLSLPETDITVYDLLPAVFGITDAINARSIEAVAAMGKTIGCGPGCDACCHQLVPVSEYEAAHLAGVVRAMPAAQRSRVVKRFTHAIALLDASGLMTPLNETFAREAHNCPKLLDLKKQYWDLKIPCPFLEESVCSIHEHRPLICRQYLVTSCPSMCADIYTIDEAHEVVLHPVDIGGALASFSGEGLQHSRLVPLIFSLLAEPAIRSQSQVRLPAQQMMGRFLNVLAAGFVRKE